MAYHAASLNPTTEQAHMLAHGARIILKPHQIGCGHAVYLTATQATRIAKSHRAGKSAHLRLSEAQLRHHRTHGTGFFSDLVRNVKGAARSAYAIAQPLLDTPAGQALKQRAIEGATNLAQQQLGKVASAVQRRFGGAIHPQHRGQHGEGIFDDIMGGIGTVAKTIGPFAPLLMGIGAPKVARKSRARHPAAQHGEGIFDDIMGGIGKVAQVAAPFALPLLQKRFGGAVAPRRAPQRRHAQMQQGEGIFDDIMGGIGSVAQAVAPIAMPFAQSMLQKRFGGGVKKRAPRKAGGGLFD